VPAPGLGEPGLGEPGRMQGFVTDLLRHEGALVEAVEPEGLEVLAPRPVQQALGLGELSRLGFGGTLPPGAQRVGLEGDWLDRFAQVLGPRGRWTRRVLSTPSRAPGDPEGVLGQELVLDNATFRLLDVSSAWTRYLVLDFRISAVSDDKRDFTLRLGVNLATGALPDAVLAALAPMLDVPADWPALGGSGSDAAMPDDAALPVPWERARLLGLVARALPPRVETALAPFVKGLRRRLGRDQDRLHAYHNDLHRETVLCALALAEGDPRRRREEQRAEAIGREYRAKLDDLARQYATRVTVEWVQTLELAMPVQRFTVQVRRRKADRTIRLDWNQAARRLETPACEWSASAERPRLVCDDALHLVVPAALGPCQSCGRPFCRACHPERCPKCAAGEPLADDVIS
jgi:hypothetical protein